MLKYRKPAYATVYSEESVLQDKVLKWLAPMKRDGIKAIRVCDRYNGGYSDILICVRGIFVAAELKDDTGTPSQAQLDFIDDIIKAGGIGGVCTSVKDVSDLVDKALERTGTDTWTM